jgi:ribonuclease T2
MRSLVLAFALALPAAAQDRAGEFDYYVLALSWQPTWCALEGEGSEQCTRPAGWTLHGLWPQHERGWPSDCRTSMRDPSRRETAGMADIMGSAGLAWYQWQRHGRCAGLDPADYFALARTAYGNVTRPEVLRQLDEPVRLPAGVVEEAFLRDNPDLTDAGLTVTCKSGHVQEIRICLTRELKPRDCAPDIRRDCNVADAILLPID